MDARARDAPDAGSALAYLRGASGQLETQSRRPKRARVQRAGARAGRVLPTHGVHARRTAARHGASPGSILGLSGDRLLRADQPFRRSGRLSLFRGSSAPAGRRRVAGLGPRAFSQRRPRPRLFRRHAPVRARRSPARGASRMGHPHLQLRPQRSPQFSVEQRALLVGGIPHRRLSCGCRGLHAVPGLRAGGRRLGAQRIRPTGKSGSRAFPARVQPPRP